MTSTPTPRAVRRRRIVAIRRRVAATTLATFALAFAVIDLTGSMGRGTAHAAQPSVRSTAPQTTLPQTTAPDTSAPAAHSGDLGAVTTRQS